MHNVKSYFWIDKTIVPFALKEFDKMGIISNPSTQTCYISSSDPGKLYVELQDLFKPKNLFYF
jgi:hypothetical protein